MLHEIDEIEVTIPRSPEGNILTLPDTRDEQAVTAEFLSDLIPISVSEARITIMALCFANPFDLAPEELERRSIVYDWDHHAPMHFD